MYWTQTRKTCTSERESEVQFGRPYVGIKRFNSNLLVSAQTSGTLLRQFIRQLVPFFQVESEACSVVFFPSSFCLW